MVVGGAAGPAGATAGGGVGAAGGGVWAKARPATSVVAVTPTAPTSMRRDTVAQPLSSNRFDELMSVTPNGFSLCEFYQGTEERGRIPECSGNAAGTALPAILLPARRGGIVAFVGTDPFLAGRRLLELPERSLGLEPVYQEFAGLEGCFAMRRADGHQHDAVTGLEPAIAMDDQSGLQRPATASLGLDVLQRLLGHAGI